MFGYVVPDKTKISARAFTVYRAFYCGICKTMAAEYGTLSRLFTTYDVTFLSILMHDHLNAEVRFKEDTCVAQPFKKKAEVEPNALLRKLCAVQTLLIKYKVEDDIIDGKKTRRPVKVMFKKQFEKASLLFPEAEIIIKRSYETLREAESKKESSIDKVSHCFATMLRSLTELIAQNADEDLLMLAYNVGKYVYIVDAIDDLEEDNKSGNYNPFIVAYGNFKNRKDFINEHQDVEFALTSTVNLAIASFNNRRYNQSYDVLKNIIYYGLRKRAEEVVQQKKPSKI